MRTKCRRLIILLLFWLAFIPFRTVSADTGPKPTMGFDFIFEPGISGQQVTIVSGTLYECEQADCQDAKPLAQLGPQHFSCEATTCNALGYGFSPYHRLEIQFSDGKARQSNIFQTEGFNSTYKVTVRPDDLLVEGQFNPANLLPINSFPVSVVLLCACLLCLIVVVIVVVVILVVKRRSKKT
jgi:hypothetical protein